MNNNMKILQQEFKEQLEEYYDNFTSPRLEWMHSIVLKDLSKDDLPKLYTINGYIMGVASCKKCNMSGLRVSVEMLIAELTK